MSIQHQFNQLRCAETVHPQYLAPIQPAGPIHLIWAVFLACLVLAPAQAQVNYADTNVTVATIGGGPPPGNFCAKPAGFVDGNTLENSQFNGPVALALNSRGTVFIADKTNNAVRMITSIGDTSASLTVTSPFLTNLRAAVGVAVDAADNLYVLTQGDKALRKYNASLNLIYSNVLQYSPVALAVSRDSATNIFVVFTNGTVLRFAQSGAAIVATNIIVANGTKLNGSILNPGGIAWRSDGVLAVSDLADNAIYLLAGTNNSVPTLYAGGGSRVTAGWVDGLPALAKFDQPAGLSWSPDGQLVVADRANNAVRRIDASGITSTIYGVPSTLWGSSVCSQGIFAGWVDGAPGAYQTNATADAPVGVLVAPSGTVYVTELAYDLLREVTGVAFASSTNGGTNGSGATNVVIQPPSFTPYYGYFPECQTIHVTSSAPNVYYTTDGTAPTTNSSMMVDNMVEVITNGAPVYEGSFPWCNSLHDLSSLRLIAVSGTNVSLVTNGVSSPISEIGFPAALFAGSGATAVVPVVVNLQSNSTLASLQFDIEIIPTNGAPPLPPGSVTLLPISTNDFLQLTGPSPGNSPVNFEIISYTPAGNNGVGLAVFASGSSGLNVANFAAITLLEVPVPATAVEGQRYTLEVLYPSGTSDGAQAEVTLTAMPRQTLTVSNLVYFAGDSSPSGGYEAGEFGDGALNNSDVNNALMASVGIRVPFPFTDAYNAMCVFPETTLGSGFIKFLDWQHILMRSLGVETNNWIRFWTDGGVLSHAATNWSPGQIIPIGVSPSKASPAETENAARASVVSQPAADWLRQASIRAGTIAGLVPGNSYSIPVTVNVLPGYSLAGLQFRATLLANGNAPPPGRIKFTPASALPAPYANAEALAPNDVYCAWSLVITPALQGSNFLGSIAFQVPPAAQTGQSYTLRILGVDGSPDLNTIYQLESVPGTAWVASAALTPPQITSDEWRTNFFGSTTNALAQDTADPDGDGMPNWQEYLAGTNPTNALSALQFISPAFASGGSHDIIFSWQTAPGRMYLLQSSLTAGGNNWMSVHTNLGDGNAFQISLTNHPGNACFYRIQLLQP
jgi:hypothetical protein